MKPVALSEYPALSAYSGKTLVVYDGECPFCARFAAWQRLKDSVGPVSLHNARVESELVSALWAEGFDLNEGMVLIWNDQVFFGDDCVNRLALLSSGSGLFNKLNSVLFRSSRVSALMYPMLRAGRLAVLKVLGRKRLSPNDSTDAM